MAVRSRQPVERRSGMPGGRLACGLRARVPILAIDEYQGSGFRAHRIVLALCLRSRVRLFAVGDPDQSIYGFAGTQPHLLRQIGGRANVDTVRLRLNYRSGPTIVKASEIALGEDRGYATSLVR